MPNPAVEIKDGAGAYASAVDGVNVTPGNTITLHLIDSSADSWSILCITTDDLSDKDTVNAALVVDALARTATFTAPVAGRAYRFKSIVNGGVNGNGRADPLYITTFCVYTTVSGARVIAADETTEGDSVFGWLARINALIRGGGGIASQGAAGVAQQSDGAGALQAESLSIDTTYQSTALWEDTANSGTVAPKATARARRRQAQTTTATVSQVIDNGGSYGGEDFVLPDNAITHIYVRLLVKKSATAAGGMILLEGTYYRNSAGNATLIGTVAVTYNLTGSTLDGTTAALVINGTRVEVQVSPESADTLNWAIVRVHEEGTD